MQTENKKFYIVGLIGVLIFGNLFFGFRSASLSQKLTLIENENKIAEQNDKVVSFLELFIQNVLKAEGEVNFDTRLSLENAIRNIGDKEILQQWNDFIESKTESDAQNEVKLLLELLVSKI